MNCCIWDYPESAENRVFHSEVSLPTFSFSSMQCFHSFIQQIVIELPLIHSNVSGVHAGDSSKKTDDDLCFQGAPISVTGGSKKR